MSNDTTTRRILPQSSQMGTFAFAPTTYHHPQQPRETQKNYVFVDEHNRHKRLKVMRACEGCRRRKIKCDAATTNTWPCSACIRLKLHCVRPNGFDSTADTQTQTYEPVRSHFESPHVSSSFRQALPLQDQPLLSHAPKPAPHIYQPVTSYPDTSSLYHPVQYTEPQPVPHDLHYAPVHHPVNVVEQQYTTAQPATFPTPPPLHQTPQSASSPSDAQSEYAQQDLADLLGSLKVNEAGTAPYLNSKLRSSKDEEPAVEEDDDFKSLLPPLTSGPGTKIRIPPELMPDDETVLRYFDLYFTHAHPYVPVLDKTQFYHQWQNNRDSISPLLLEAIFAIAGRLADEPAQGQQWLALASRHADSFMDVPRLSTLQALMILLKAKESAPKKGYYYRSWMSIVQAVQLGKDLGLDEHYADHQAGRCAGSPAECALKTRIWQTLFVVELMIGSPQGRTDFQVEEETVDFSIPRPLPNQDESEYQVSRNFVYLARIVRAVGRMVKVYKRLKRTKDWGIDPAFVQADPEHDSSWLTSLPSDLTVTFPPDGSPPYLPSAYVGNVHTYYWLSIILFHRPQLTALSHSAPGGQWKQHMLVASNAAKMICRLQEAVLNSFGMTGLQCMQRGINFTIYAVLQCLVLHLVAITCPDPDVNAESREYFTRHMRLIEKCMSAWPMPEMQKQIDSIREAFSADTRKPFVLKPTFPYGSPHSTSHPSPPGRHLDTHVPHSQVSLTSHPLTPVSAASLDAKSESPVVQALTSVPSVPASQAQGVTDTLPMPEAPTWNPSRIFDQWNNTFGAPQIQSTPPPVTAPTPSLGVPSANGVGSTGLHDIPSVPSQLRTTSQPIPPPPQYAAAPIQTFVTPAMWQESVASVYEGGIKRSWDYDSHLPIKRHH